MSEIRRLREAVNDLADVSTAELDDEAWYDRLWQLLDPVIDARAERQLAATLRPQGEQPDWVKNAIRFPDA